MEYLLVFLLVIGFVSCIQAQSFTQESPYMNIRLMDLKSHEWKPAMLDNMEKVLDAELKYIDEKKGFECKSIDFEQEAGYPKQDSRFLDLSIRGLCTDENGKVHNIDKAYMGEAIKRHISDVNRVTGSVVYVIDKVQLYARDRNKLNLIIIPISVGFVLFLVILTFVLRSLRNRQKRRHIEAELQKKQAASLKKAQMASTTANVDPNANEKQRLLQLDPTVVGSASDTLGSPKGFTNDQPKSPTRSKLSGGGDNRFVNRDYQGAPPPVPTKENRPPYHGHEDDTAFQTQRPLRTNRERMHVPYETDSRFSPSHSQYPNQGHSSEMIPMHEQQPRVVVRSVRDDGNYPNYYQQQEEPSTMFVPIPVQIERSGPQQRFVPPPYHSDPYYRHTNA